MKNFFCKEHSLLNNEEFYEVKAKGLDPKQKTNS
jgi:hypothetical protein